MDGGQEVASGLERREEGRRRGGGERRRGREEGGGEEGRRCSFNALILDLASLPATLSAVTTTNLLRS